MIRNIFFTLAFLVTLNVQAAKPLNVVLILVDDLGWMDLSCQGSRYFETPHIDRLAADGMRFTDAYAACAVCSPTRAAVQTGRYPGRLGVTDWIRSRFQGGTIPSDKKNPSGFSGSKRKFLVPKNAPCGLVDPVLAPSVPGIMKQFFDQPSGKDSPRNHRAYSHMLIWLIFLLS